MNESEERSDAREEMDRAVRKFVSIVAKEDGVTDSSVVLGWVGFAEYTSVELEAMDATGSVSLVPDGQPTSMSRGLSEFGSDAFSRSGSSS